MQRPATPRPDLLEHGGEKDGKRQSSNRRLFMQLLAFTGCADTQPLIEALNDSPINGALYIDVADPRGVALLTYHEDPEFFVSTLRDTLNSAPFNTLTQKHEFTMFGRTYSLGYEPDLEETLFERPIRTATNADWPWAVWYPLRRSGAFEKLLPREQRDILMEHGVIGRSFGEADYAHDIRLASHGLDRNDSDFTIGLMGKHLFPLSAIVQAMRKTTQTSLYLERLGPFFIGRAVWQRRS